MASVLKITALILFTGFVYGQKAKLAYDSPQTITFHFERKIYDKMAADSIRSLYQKQYNFYVDADIWPHIKEMAVSLNYRFEELSFYSIPRFRLYKEAVSLFDCNANIENFIAFEEYNKYQNVIVSNAGILLCQVQVPNDIMEEDRVSNPGFHKRIDGFVYERLYLQKLFMMPPGNHFYDNVINNKDHNFFFEIYGLDEVLFEIESKTNVLYANYYGQMLGPDAAKRIPANDFIRQFIGERRIRVLATGNFDDIASDEVDLPTPCRKNIKNKRNVLLKVTETK